MVSRGCSVCGGGGDTCNCLVVAGDNIDVAGVGSTEFPYVISAPDVPKAQKVWCGADGIPIGYSLVDKEGVQEFFLSNGSFAGLILPDGWEECKCVCQSGTGGTLYPDWQTLVINGLGELALAYDGVETVYIKNANVTAEKVDLSVADQTARDAIASPWEGLQVYREDTDRTEIFDGTLWRTMAQIEELKRVTLTVAGDTISATSIPARKYLHIIYSVQSTGGTINTRISFNNDSGANYAWQELVNLTLFSNNVSQSIFAPTTALSTSPRHGRFDINNITAQRKLFTGYEIDDNSGGAATSANNKTYYGKWDNTSAQITRVDLTNVGVGDFAIGSELVIFGWD